MGKYQTYRGNSENKLFYLIDQLDGGINTDFSDDGSADNEFKSIVNFNMDKRGSLYKRMGFGKLNAVSQIFAKFSETPEVKNKTEANPNPEDYNDNIVYMKLLINENNCFRNLSAFTGDKAYRKYQQLYGAQNNSFKLLFITTNNQTNKSKSWLYSCTLPELEYDQEGDPTATETIILTEDIQELPVVFKWDRNLTNINTIEFFDKIYFTNNNKGLVCFDRTNDTFSYFGSNIGSEPNNAYKPSPMEIRKVGFNVLGDDPLHWVDYQGLTTDSIQGIYLTTTDNKPTTVIPSVGKFRINVLYTGSDSGFDIKFKEGEYERSASVVVNADYSTTGLKCYDVTFTTTPTSNVEIKITKTGATINDYYDYYDVGAVDPEIKPVSTLNIGEYEMLEMYNRAVYFKDDTIWFSELNNFNYIPNYNYVSLPIEPTDKITKIIFFRNVYVIFTKFRIYKMSNAFGDADFQVVPLNLSMGCHAPNTIVPIENVLYFASSRGIYQLISSAAYGNSSNSITFENVKEIDTKVKSLTSNVTMYLGELTDPAVRYNGISEHSYAIRYKDKYMLFFNTAYEQGDIAALKNLDVLVYNYDLKAFTEMRFPEKPTFMFMVDGAIEAYCTVPQKEEYSVEETLLEYNFGDTENGIVEDASGNGHDAKTVGNMIIKPGIGINLDGDNNYIKTGVISSNFNLKNGFKVLADVNIDDVDDAYLYNLKQATATGQATPQTFTISTNWANGYKADLICRTTPDNINKTVTVSYTLKYYRSSTSINNKQSGSFTLKDTTTNTNLINETNFTFDLGSTLSKEIKTGSFVINQGDAQYNHNWKLTVSSLYPTYRTRREKGSSTSFDVVKNSQFSNLYGIRIAGTAVATDTGCRITYTPYAHCANYGSLYTGERDLYAFINGTQHNHRVAAINNDGNGVKNYSGGQQTQDISYNGQPTISIDGRWNIRATISGVYQENVEIDAFNFTLPLSKNVQETVWHSFSVSGSYNVVLEQMLNISYKNLAVKLNNANSLDIICNSEYTEFSTNITSQLSLLGEHNIEIDYNKSNSVYVVTILVDGEIFGQTNVPQDAIVNANRDSSILGLGIIGTIMDFKIILSDNKPIIIYDFDDGKGTYITDKSGNSLRGNIVGNVDWVVEDCIKFDGKTSYIIIPTLSSNIPFSNGYSIEFEGKFANVSQISKIIDLASDYNTGSLGDLKCSINCGKFDNTNNLLFESYGISKKRINIVEGDINLLEKHKWKYDVVDNGKNYDIKLYCDNTLIATDTFNYGGISNVIRRSNFIGKSNRPGDDLFSGTLYNLKITINKSPNPAPIYENDMFEYDTSYDDFGKDMEIELETKGINLQYPIHNKKLKHIFIKGLGGYQYKEFFCEVYVDGHLVNDPYKYNYTIEEGTGTVIYDYTEIKNLSFDEKISILGNMRLDRTKLGESAYQTKKLVIPCKGKNFSLKIYGMSSDYLSIESFGFVCKLGKVKED